jgi:hypothetical protein
MRKNAIMLKQKTYLWQLIKEPNLTSTEDSLNWEANKSSTDSQEIPHILCNVNVN